MKRIIFLDYLRVIACLMVVIVHSCEIFYLQDGLVIYSNPANRWWVSAIDGLFRCSVPLFVMASAYLLVPLKTDTTTFIKKRFVRIFIPFIIWSVFYAVVPIWLGTLQGSAVDRLAHLLYSFNDDSGHLWYIYMLIGVYALIPIISPWLKQVSKRGELIFLGIWLITTVAPYIRERLGDVWGECAWNSYGALYYFSGFVGYVVLGHFIRTHLVMRKNMALLLGVILSLIGWAITGGLFYYRSGISSDYFFCELPFRFCTIGVVLLTTGIFILFKTGLDKPIKCFPAVESLSKLSYGIYLMHIFILGFAAQIILPAITDLPGMLLVGVTTFIVSAILCKLINLLPFGKYITG